MQTLPGPLEPTRSDEPSRIDIPEPPGPDEPWNDPPLPEPLTPTPPELPDEDG